MPVHHWGDMIADYEETAAFLENLDLVLTVNTSQDNVLSNTASSSEGYQLVAASFSLTVGNTVLTNTGANSSTYQVLPCASTICEVETEPA